MSHALIPNNKYSLLCIVLIILTFKSIFLLTKHVICLKLIIYIDLLAGYNKKIATDCKSTNNHYPSTENYVSNKLSAIKSCIE